MAYTRQIINVGTTADDGSGDYLRDALIKANTNFQNLWQVGAVDTNLDLTGTTIASVTANSNITLDPNGTGKIVLASSVEPDTTDSKDLGSATKTWNNIHANTVFADKTILNAQASAPSSPVEGTLYYNTSTDNFVGYANGNWSNLSGAVTASSTDTFTNKGGAISQWTNDSNYSTTTGTVTSVAGGTGLTGGTITGTGTLAVDVGTTANKIVQLDGSAKLPAVDGSALTNIVTATSSTAFTNKTGAISQWTNNSGYLAAETMSLAILKTHVAASSDFADFKTRIAGL